VSFSPVSLRSGIDSIATVLADHGNKIGSAALTPAFERTIIQRCGNLLDQLEFDAQVEV
jgi:hypothetical protein